MISTTLPVWDGLSGMQDIGIARSTVLCTEGVGVPVASIGVGVAVATLGEGRNNPQGVSVSVA